MRSILPLIPLLLLSVSSFTQYDVSDSLTLNHYMDGMIETHLKDENIAGATLSIVHNGKVVVLKGYGYSDVAEKTPVDPEHTLFRIGSITKLFAWTAIMQLQSQGKLSLEDDITTYIKDFELPDNYKESITFKHLMTHTAGFEDEIIGLFAQDEASLLPLGEIIRNEMPARVRPPGTQASYSNHGTGMAAYIVEQLSGLTFDEYAERHIIEPIGMDRATIRQPLPDDLAAHMSKGYTYTAGEFVEESFEYVPLSPVGAASASAASMAKFMLMYLNNGTYNGNTILDSTTYALMKTPAHRHHPMVNPMRHGLMDVSQNQQTIIGHGGDTFWFHSLMALFPQHNLGIFISFNSEAGGGISQAVLESFTDRYFPEVLEDLALDEGVDLSKFAGEYAMNRYSHDDVLKVGKLMGVGNIEVTDNGHLKTLIGGDVDYWVQQDDLVFRNKDDSNTLVFKEGENGQITNAFLGLLPIVAMDKLEGIDKVAFHSQLFIGSMILFVLSFLYWTLSFFYKKRFNLSNTSNSQFPKTTRMLFWIAIALLLLFYLLLAVSFSNPFSIVYGVSTPTSLIFILPIVVGIIALVLAYHIFRLWSSGTDIRVWKKLFATLIWLALIGAVWQWNYWNILGFQF